MVLNVCFVSEIETNGLFIHEPDLKLGFKVGKPFPKITFGCCQLIFLRLFITPGKLYLDMVGRPGGSCNVKHEA